MNLEHYNIIRDIQVYLDNNYPHTIYEKKLEPHTHIQITDESGEIWKFTSEHHADEGFFVYNKESFKNVMNLILKPSPLYLVGIKQPLI